MVLTTLLKSLPASSSTAPRFFMDLCACASTEAGDGDQAIDSETVTNINEEELASELMQDDDSASKSKGKIYKIWTCSEWTSLQK